MSRVLYLDIFSGISGDMLLGALFDLGVQPLAVESELRKLPLGPWHWHVHRTTRGPIAGYRVEVHPSAADAHLHEHPHPHEPAAPHPDHQHRSFREIQNLIDRSPLSPWVREKALAIFQRIAEAEARIHGQPAESVHFHEVGALDSLIDILGGCLALEQLGRPHVWAAPVVDGTGWVHCAHGRFPLPAPATLAILGTRGIPISQCEEPHEMVTPTGAAFLAEFVEYFGPMQNLVAERIGFGLGSRVLRTRPNALRAVLGPMPRSTDSVAPALDWETDTVAVLETNLDDATGETLGHFMDVALRAGALDVFYIPVQTKKNRPGILLSVLCNPAEADRMTELILRETPALGVRRLSADRRKLRRELVRVDTPYGPVHCKMARLNNRVVQLKPEWDECCQRAAQFGVSPRTVWQAALAAATTPEKF